MAYMDVVLTTGATSPEFLAVGNCDLLIQGLAAGTIKLQYKLPVTVALPVPAWVDFPDGSFTTNIFQTIFFSEHGIKLRFVGVGNTNTSYVKISRFLNK